MKAIIAVIILGLAGFLVVRPPEPQIVEKIVEVKVPVAPPAPAPTPEPKPTPFQSQSTLLGEPSKRVDYKVRYRRPLDTTPSR